MVLHCRAHHRTQGAGAVSVPGRCDALTNRSAQRAGCPMRGDAARQRNSSRRALASFLPIPRSAAIAGMCLARGRTSPSSHL